MPDKLSLDDVRFQARHGGPAAAVTGAWFSVDAELALDLAPAAIADDLGATVDYERVTQRIIEIGTGPRVHLLERLAALIAEALLREFPAEQVRVRVRRLVPPRNGVAGTPSVELVRRR